MSAWQRRQTGFVCVALRGLRIKHAKVANPATGSNLPGHIAGGARGPRGVPRKHGVTRTGTRIGQRRNPPEPIVLVHYGPWHFFFAIFLEMVISSGRSEPTVVIKLLPSPWEKKERAHGSFQRSWASCDNFFCQFFCDNFFCRLGKNDSATLKVMERWALHDTTHACSHFTTTNSHSVLLVSLTP
jgi:hypothetical protein